MSKIFRKPFFRKILQNIIVFLESNQSGELGASLHSPVEEIIKELVNKNNIHYFMQNVVLDNEVLVNNQRDTKGIF